MGRRNGPMNDGRASIADTLARKIRTRSKQYRQRPPMAVGVADPAGFLPSPGRKPIAAAPQNTSAPGANSTTGCCRPPLAIVQKGADAEQKRRKRISFLAEIEEPDSDQNAYYDHGDDFEHGVRSGRFSGSHAERLAEGLSW